MLFKKTERKKIPAMLGLTVGALAAVGVVSLKNKGKGIINSVSSKMKNMMKKAKDECPMDNMME